MNLASGGHRSVDERRVQLLDAAFAVLREHGLTGLTTRAVTARAGLPHGIFHYAFGSKAALVRALVERELTRATAAWDAAVTVDDDLESALRGAVRAQLDIVRADPSHQAAMFELVRAAQDDAGADTVAWERRQYRAEIERHLAAWSQRCAVVWTAPVAHVASLTLAAADGVIQAWVADHDDARAEASVELLARALASLAHPA